MIIRQGLIRSAMETLQVHVNWNEYACTLSSVHDTVLVFLWCFSVLITVKGRNKFNTLYKLITYATGTEVNYNYSGSSFA